MSDSSEQLNKREVLFCEHYIIGFNGTQSAIKAGYSERSAGCQASRMLKKRNVQLRIHELKVERMQRTGIEADDVVRELAKMAFSNMSEYLEFDEKGVLLKDSNTLTLDQLAAVSQVTERKTSRMEAGEDGKRKDVIINNTVGFKLHDKTKALELLGRHLAMFTDNHIIDAKASLLEVLGKAGAGK